MIVPAYYQPYLDKTYNNPLMVLLRDQITGIPEYLRSLDQGQWLHKYAPDKWTPKELMVHINDTERIFSYRALRFARADETELAGFEQNEYVPASMADLRTPGSIIDEFIAIRQSTIALFNSFDNDMLLRSGKANGVIFDVEACGLIIAGHLEHHFAMLKERYFPGS